MRAFVAFENLFWFLHLFQCWLLCNATFKTVITYALKRIILRPRGRSNFEFLLVDPVLPHVQDILVKCLLVLKTGYDKIQGDLLGCGKSVTFEFPPLPCWPSSVCVTQDVGRNCVNKPKTYRFSTA